jgi:hypothetical protein
MPFKSERSAYNYVTQPENEAQKTVPLSFSLDRVGISNGEDTTLSVHQAQALCSIRPVRSAYVGSLVFGGNKCNKLLIDILWHFWAFPALDMHSCHILGRLIPAEA